MVVGTGAHRFGNLVIGNLPICERRMQDFVVCVCVKLFALHFAGKQYLYGVGEAVFVLHM